MTSEVGFKNFVTIVELLALDFVIVARIEFDEIRNFLSMEVRGTLYLSAVPGFHLAMELLINIAIIFIVIRKDV